MLCLFSAMGLAPEINVMIMMISSERMTDDDTVVDGSVANIPGRIIVYRLCRYMHCSAL